MAGHKTPIPRDLPGGRSTKPRREKIISGIMRARPRRGSSLLLPTARALRVALGLTLLAGPLGAPLRVAAAPSTPRGPSQAVFQPMRFARVVADDPSCRPNCAEWISAEGQIVLGTSPAFAREIVALAGRRLPVLINSPGGSTVDAMAMGRLIRAQKLAVAVAHTELTPCAGSTSACGESRGTASSYGAFCGSACPLVLAGGIERYASPLSLIAVHHFWRMVTKTTVLRNYLVYYRIIGGKKEEISRKLTSEKRNQTTEKQAPTAKNETELASYLSEMGIGAPIRDLYESTPSTTVRYLAAEELQRSRLITIWIDEPTAILGGLGANGLTGVPVDAPSDHKAVLIAQTGALLPPSSTGLAAALQASFAYRRGGGIVEFTAAIRPTDEKAGGQTLGNGFRLELRNGDKGVVQLKSTDGAPLQSPIPLAWFCNFARGGRLLFSWLNDPSTVDSANAIDSDPHAPGTPIEAGAMPGIPALSDEACPLSAKKI